MYYFQIGEYQFFSLAGTVELEVPYKSSPATLGEPRVGDRACSVSFTYRSREVAEDDEDGIFFMCIDFRSRSLDSSQCKVRIGRW